MLSAFTLQLDFFVYFFSGYGALVMLVKTQEHYEEFTSN